MPSQKHSSQLAEQRRPTSVMLTTSWQTSRAHEQVVVPRCTRGILIRGGWLASKAPPSGAAAGCTGAGAEGYGLRFERAGATDFIGARTNSPPVGFVGTCVAADTEGDGAVPGTHLTVELMVPIHDDAVAIETAAASEGRRAARELYRQALADADGRAVEASGGARQRIEHRWLATLMGHVRVGRYRVRTDHRTHRPLDEMLELRTGEASPGIRSLVHRLAGRLSTREIAEVVTEVTGTAFSRHAVLRILHQDRPHVPGSTWNRRPRPTRHRPPPGSPPDRGSS